MTNQNISKALKLQLEIERVADIKYQCYYLKLDEWHFWQKYIWDALKLNKMEET